MKRILLVVMVLGSIANADVVKPINTSNSSTGLASVNGIPFKYAVGDRGWYASIDSSGIVYAKKSFLFMYESTRAIQITEDTTTATLLGIDVAQKCAELGSMEYPGQIKALPTDLKPALKTSIVSPTVPKDEYSGHLLGRFVCLVEITTSK